MAAITPTSKIKPIPHEMPAMAPVLRVAVVPFACDEVILERGMERGTWGATMMERWLDSMIGMSSRVHSTGSEGQALTVTQALP